MTLARLNDVQFCVNYSSLREIEAEARKEGWTPESGDAPSDYADPVLCGERSLALPTFEAAMAWIRQHFASGDEYWGAVCVYKEIYQRDPSAPGLLTWQECYRWDVTAEGVEYESPVGCDDG